MVEESLVLKLLDYGIAGLALFLLYKISNDKLKDISNKLDIIANKIDELKDEMRRARK